MNKSDKLLSVKDLTIHYETEEDTVYAVNNVSFDLRKGETLGIVGETGAGKTTISLGIMRLIPDPPGRIINGEIIFNGENLLSLKPINMRNVRGNRISMIFQDPMTALNPIKTVGEQILEVIHLHERLTKAETQQKALDMLKLVGIPIDRYSEYPHQFSGGMKQRIVIAIALACRPELLIADEPTTALDVTIQAQVLEMMNKLKYELNTSMIMITHDLGVVAEMCDRIAILYGGEIIEIGKTIHIFDETMHPYTKGLFASLPSVAQEAKRLKPISGMMPDLTYMPQGCKFAPHCQFKTEVCENIAPELIEVSEGHKVRCHLIRDMEGR